MTQHLTSLNGVALTDAQTSLLDDVTRQARWSDQQTSRTRLRDAIPALAGVFSEDDGATRSQGNNSDPERAENRDRWLSTIWPKDRLISELDEEYVDDEHEAVKVFDFEKERFERNPSVSVGITGLHIHHEDVQTSKSDPYDFEGEEICDEYTNTSAHHLIVLSSMAAVVVKADCGDFGDDEFDASAYGTVYLSENPRQMLALLRSRLAQFPAEALSGKDVEADLARIFGRDYAPADPASAASAANASKGFRP